MEAEVLGGHQALCELLVHQGLRMERRPTRIAVRDLQWRVDETGRTLELGFVLGRGQYATSVLREVLDYEDVTRTGHPEEPAPP
jgi:tRNA pseudouridine13 synthase